MPRSQPCIHLHGNSGGFKGVRSEEEAGGPAAHLSATALVGVRSWPLPAEPTAARPTHNKPVCLKNHRPVLGGWGGSEPSSVTKQLTPPPQLQFFPSPRSGVNGDAPEGSNMQHIQRKTLPESTYPVINDRFSKSLSASAIFPANLAPHIAI